MKKSDELLKLWTYYFLGGSADTEHAENLWRAYCEALRQERL